MKEKCLLYSLVLVFALALASPAQAQIELDWKDFSVGGGSMFGEESVTFSWDAAFAAVHWQGVGIFGQGSTGAGVEIHPASIVSVVEDGSMSIDTVDWRLWSLNRVKMSVFPLPGEIWDSMFLGSDVVVAEGGGFDFTEDFTVRFVYGFQVDPVQIEIYMFEPYRPISILGKIPLQTILSLF
ncbi:MAG: hypothetical protein JSV16_13335 [Candidatus Hydrogenedentota bacterium]|nr:MAG: hypothetical protein JSV16_13335 [Candidatus Hydrogenedentota bacterium]